MSRLVARPVSVIDRHRSVRGDTASGRSLVRQSDLATVVAVGPFDDLEHANELVAMFTGVQKKCRTQLVLLGRGTHRSLVVRRAAERALQVRLALNEDCAGPQRSDLLAAADIVIPSPDSAPTTLVEVMAAGRAVVASAGPATAALVMPHSAGLLYRPGDVSAMTAAVVRLLEHPALRNQMGSRASQVARAHRLHMLSQQSPDDLKKYV
jgi:glycosyltransferase involved in cell wall biosynthesis